MEDGRRLVTVDLDRRFLRRVLIVSIAMVVVSFVWQSRSRDTRPRSDQRHYQPGQFLRSSARQRRTPDRGKHRYLQPIRRKCWCRICRADVVNRVVPKLIAQSGRRVSLFNVGWPGDRGRSLSFDS